MLEWQEIFFSPAIYIQKYCIAIPSWLGPCVRHTYPRMALAESAFRLRKVGVQQGRSVCADPGRLKRPSFGRSRFRIHRILIHGKERDISGDFAFRFKGAFEYQYPGFASDIADRKLDGA